MLSIIYIDFLCDDEKKQEILENEQRNIEAFNTKVSENIFKKNKKEKKTEVVSNALIVRKEKNIIQKIIEKIKSKIYKNIINIF